MRQRAVLLTSVPVPGAPRLGHLAGEDSSVARRPPGLALVPKNRIPPSPADHRIGGHLVAVDRRVSPVQVAAARARSAPPCMKQVAALDHLVAAVRSGLRNGEFEPGSGLPKLVERFGANRWLPQVCM